MAPVMAPVNTEREVVIYDSYDSDSGLPFSPGDTEKKAGTGVKIMRLKSVYLKNKTGQI
jgi:hypothetical protein